LIDTQKTSWDDAFLSDQANVHYANKVQDYLNTKKIQFMPKSINSSRIPKVRLIEDIWFFKVEEL
jgi:hypothetical protein